MSHGKVIPPGSTIGILGDGQLGKMIAVAAAKLGYRVAVLGPGGRDSPTGHVAYWAKKWEHGAQVSDALLAEFLELVSVVLIEWENVPVELVERIEAEGTPVRPSSKVLAVAQDRLLEKQLAQSLGIPVAPFRNIETSKDLDAGPVVAPVTSILKTRRDGYDGKGQKLVPHGRSIVTAWIKSGNVPCILEERIDFVGEVSVIVVRSPHTANEATPSTIVYGPFENVHEKGILRTTKYPVTNNLIYRMLHGVVSAAEHASRKLAMHLDVHGLLAVEFFVTKDERVLFNEMAPRPHNSGHLTIECCDTSQFEQYVRAACNLPFGSDYFHSNGEMENILGAEANKWMDYMSEPRASVHLYGKDEAKPGRKMGHVTYHYSNDD